VLWKDAEVAEVGVCTEAPCTARFALEPARDAVYVVQVEADRTLDVPFPGGRSWAATGPVRVDVDGDGWTAPKSPIVAR
jgi:hypothetical protein